MPGQISRKSQVEIGQFGQKNKLYTLGNFYFSNKNYCDSNRSWNVLSIRKIIFFKYYDGHESYAKMYEKTATVQLYEKCYNFEKK